MKKFTVFSGFLGSGKTTTMMALTKYCTDHGFKAAMISNDLGHGVTLADDRLAKFCGCNASEITEDCICYRNEFLADRLESYYDDGCCLVISDIPGFGVGALEHVYHGLNEKFPGRFELAPFTVLVEPGTIELLEEGLSGDIRYIYDTQLAEADLIVLNKCDTVSEEKKQACLSWIKKCYPEADVVAISALKREGLDILSEKLLQGNASMKRPDIGYGQEAFTAAMGRICEYYIQYRATVCCNEFDGNTYILDIAKSVQKAIKEAGYDIPHMKLLAWEAEGDFAKADLLGSEKEIEVTHSFKDTCTEIAVLLNASAICPSDVMDEKVTETVKEISDKYQLDLLIHKKECFGMTS